MRAVGVLSFATLALGCRLEYEYEYSRLLPIEGQGGGAVQPPTVIGGTPVPPDGELWWVQVDGGGNHACGLVSDGSLRCWGLEVCTGGTPEGPERYVEVSAGLEASCAIREDGELDCWCCDEFGFDTGPVCGGIPDGPFVDVEVGEAWACAQRADGSLACWGSRDLDRYGAVPVGPVEDFAMDINLACAVLEDGTEIACWGSGIDDGYGLGTGWGEGELPPDGVTWSAISLGRRHACGLDVAGVAHCWGQDLELTPFPDPPQGVFASIETFQQVSCGLRADGSAECWWGCDLIIERSELWIPPDEPFAQLGLGEWSSCGATLDGKAYCWGLNSSVELDQVPLLE